MRGKWPWVPFWLAVLAGCSQYQHAPCSKPEDCESGLCVNGWCVLPTDVMYDTPSDALEVLADPGRDEAIADPDAGGADDLADLSPDQPPDEGPGEPDLPADLHDTGQELPPTTGMLCQEDADCAAGSCVEWAGGRKVCSGPCTPGCPEGMRCVPTAKSAVGTFDFECRPFPQGLCAPCGVSADCPAPDAQCLPMPGGNYCAVPCPAGTCPVGFTCVLVSVGIPAQCVPEIGTCACPPATEGCGPDAPCEDGYRCVTLGPPPPGQPGLPPVLAEGCEPGLGTCSCVATIYGQTFSCAVANEAGQCAGEMVCTADSGLGKCPVPLPEAEACDARDNDCDSETDEAFLVEDWDGTLKRVGEACGTGACAGGEVVCASADAAGCSTDAWKLEAELCGDAKDNDCDGHTDEGCWSEDLDGDGTPNDEDCDAYDAARHPGAPEPCCPQVVPRAQQAAACDFNCDGAVTACAAEDLDGDGFAGVESGGDDCDDQDAMVHPGAPEKCDDGKDQDCDGADLPCAGLTDDDEDSWPLGVDCNDDDPTIFPGAPEVCDYVDNDCDEVADDGNPGDGEQEGGAVCGSDLGVCKPGVWVCAHYPPFAARMECIGGIQAVEEVCDGLDNDCDGQTDETFPDKGQPCDGPDLDGCKNGLWACTADAKGVECLSETVHDLMETCGDGKDNDCNGVIDNGCLPEDLDGDGFLRPQDCDDTRAEFHPGAGEPCCDPALAGEAAVHACDRNCDGVVTPCSPNDRDFDGFLPVALGGKDCDDSDAEVFPGAPEKCGDGKDQDCDGQDSPCDLKDKDGDGYPPPLDCNDSNANIHPWAEEVCNNKDDDCDKVTDDGNPGGSDEPCGSNVGECAPGHPVCVHYPFQARVECVVAQGPTPEVCDGLDNNCNGLTDEVFPGLGQPCDGPDLDQCQNGVIGCSKDGTGTHCIETIENIVELCDSNDNDCDGTTDEGYAFEGVSVGQACDGLGECGPGVVVCAPDKKHAICSTMPGGPLNSAIPEVCDGLDNDCDGAADNGIFYFGQPVGAVCLGIGACGVGIVECNPASKAATCSSNPDGSKPKATPEVCNGRDDDCDGHTDEELQPGPGDCKDLGVCAGQTIPAKCKKGAWACEYVGVAGYEPEETLCDGLDNDCDGETDEGYPIGVPCDGLDSDQCKNGTWTCSADHKGWECVNESVTDIREACNGLDDDCDDATDEDFPVGQPCDGVDSDLCENGTWTCLADGTGVECVNEAVTDIPETCNGLDDDCDGETDEDFPVGQPCDGADSDLCEKGTWTCLADGTGVECVNETATDIPEACNGLDDDCDGPTDEGFDYLGAPVGEPCVGVGECGPGVVVCDAPGLGATCSTNPDGTTPAAKPEVCDQKDNDCDDATDEDLTYEGTPLGQPCTATGECGPGVVVCSPKDLTATCSSAPNGTEPKDQPEACDRKDNDCNGVTDDVPVPDKSSCLLVGVCWPDLVQAFCVDGAWVCSYDGVPGYEPGIEASCDGLDNDCDGGTDETWPVGEACDGPDSDLCPNGTWTCTPDRQGVQCANENPINIAEACNGQDDDCDGVTDEEGASGCAAWFLDVDGDGHGMPENSRCLCGPGMVPGFTAPVGDDCDDSDGGVYPGHPEACDGRDDDCDGLTDEEYPDKGTACDGPDPDQCQNGRWTCKADGNGIECVNDLNVPETCDAWDNDCDGQTDEDWPVGQACDGPDSDQCKHGTWTCKADATGAECVNETIQNLSETCNAKDDDCDGLTDEAWPDKGKGCVTGVGECQRSGLWVCKADETGIVCNATPGQPSSEVCDNKDNDCNGTTDDPWAATKGRKCDTNPTPPPGVPACALGLWQCKPDKTGLQCVGDGECVVGTQCLGSGSEFLPDSCLCGADDRCTADVANQCTITPACLCGSGPKCTSPLQCVGGTCQ